MTNPAADTPRDFIVYLVPLIDEMRTQLRKTLEGSGEEGAPIAVDNAMLFLECLFITLHLVDRLTFARDGAEGREKFMDGLLDALSEAIPADELERGYGDVQTRFARSRIAEPTTGGSLAGTLDWEVAMYIAEHVGTTNPADIMVLAVWAAGARSVVASVYNTARPPKRG